jgi:hypothetical protein
MFVLAACFCALCYQILLARSILDARKLCRHAQRIARRRRVTYSVSALFFQSFNMSNIFQGTVACCSFVLYTILYLFSSFPTRSCHLTSDTIRSNDYSFDGMGADEDQWNMLLAVAVILLWFDSLQYMLYDAWVLDGQTNSVLLLKRSLMKVLRVAVFVGPIYIGYVAFGVSMYGAQVPQFESFGAAAITLFATLNGDENRQTFEALQRDCTDCPSPLVGWVYMSSWLCFAMYVFMNIIIAIVEDTWISLRGEGPGDRHAGSAQSGAGGAERGGEELQQQRQEEVSATDLPENLEELCCGSDMVMKQTKVLFSTVVREVALEMGVSD